MKDAFGNTLNIGDRIVASHKGGRPLIKGTVIKLNASEVTYYADGYGTDYKFHTPYVQVAKYNLNEED